MKALKGFIATCVFCFSFFMFGLGVYAQEDVLELSCSYSMNGQSAIVRNTEILNLRTLPNMNSQVLETIPVGSSMTILSQEGKWFLVSYQEITGYVFWKYIEFIEPTTINNPDLLGASIIHYTSSSNRDHNIQIACDTLNGLVLQPNETFYWSKTIGQTTAKKGYLEASVIQNGKYVPGLGGGVCQVSTTLYNALLDTSILPSEVHSHSKNCAYAKQDATVAYGAKDFVFENTYDFPILFHIHSDHAVVFVEILKTK